VTQIDLPTIGAPALTEAESLLRGIEGIAFCYFTEVDVVRHPLVAEIIRAYDRKAQNMAAAGRLAVRVDDVSRRNQSHGIAATRV